MFEILYSISDDRVLEVPLIYQNMIQYVKPGLLKVYINSSIISSFACAVAFINISEIVLSDSADKVLDKSLLIERPFVYFVHCIECWKLCFQSLMIECWKYR